MSFPGKHAGTAFSFADPKENCREHIVTRPPATNMYHEKYDLTMAQYSNIEHGELLGERNERAPHIAHRK